MQNEKQKRLPREANRLLGCLKGLHRMYRDEGRLNTDGSFFRSDKLINDFLLMNRRTLQRSRNLLVAKGLISCDRGNGRYTATTYRISGMSNINAVQIESQKTNQTLSFKQEVRTLVKMTSKELAIAHYVAEGRTQSDIEACFEK